VGWPQVLYGLTVKCSMWAVVAWECGLKTLEHSRALRNSLVAGGRGAEVSTVKLTRFDQVLRLFTEETKETPRRVSSCLCHLGSHTVKWDWQQRVEARKPE